MDARSQAHIPMPQHGGQNQAFGGVNVSSYGNGTNIVPPTAQRVDWYNPRDTTTNAVVTLPANYPRQPGTNINYASLHQDPRSLGTNES